VAASFQYNLVRQLTGKLAKAVKQFKVNAILLSGGVAANSLLRKECAELSESRGIPLYYPGLKLCTDNAAMIAAAGYFSYRSHGASALKITANPGLKL
jgi:N6-L-threonylcarbamoyladenine synthase